MKQQTYIIYRTPAEYYAKLFETIKSYPLKGEINFNYGAFTLKKKVKHNKQININLF